MKTIDIYQEEYNSGYGLPKDVQILNFDRNIKEIDAIGKIIKISDKVSEELHLLEIKRDRLQEILKDLVDNAS